jgi:hypothetical protein
MKCISADLGIRLRRKSQPDCAGHCRGSKQRSEKQESATEEDSGKEAIL